MKNNYDIIIVGGGPSGSMSAYEIAKAGYSVCILEKTKKIGSPVRCGEAVGQSGLAQFFEPKERWIKSKILSIKLVSPNSTEVELDFDKETGFILDRTIFDYDLSEIASDSGAEIYTESYVKNLIIEDGFVKGVEVERLGEVEKIYSKIVIGADGIDSRVGRWGGLKTNVRMKDMESCFQYTVDNIHLNQEQMVMYVGSNYAPGGYLWIFPKGNNSANIGIGISGKHSKYKSAKKYLDSFMKEKYPDVSILKSVCGGVICAKPIRNPISNGLMLVGDAAHQINPMTGGGIISGMKAGMIAGIVASEAIEKNDLQSSFLKKYYDRMYSDFGKNYERFYRIKETVNNLTDDDLDSIASSIISIPKNKRTLRTIFTKAVYKKPSLLIDVLKVFSGL